ncbi:MAG: acyl-CoA dehydrogenase C-terminal domain-containing protein, partial [Rubrivivax sp.]
TATIAAAATADREAALRVADDYLMGLAHAFLAWGFAASARAAAAHPARDWAQAKTARMRYGVQWVLPQAAVHWARARDPSLALPQVPG